MDADGIELDVRLTADGEVVVVHDHTLDRTTDRTGVVAELSLAEVQQAVIPGTNPSVIPTLAQVLDLVRPGRMQIYFELKHTADLAPELARAAVGVIAASGLGERVIVSSFNHWSLKTVQQHAPGTRVGLLLSDGIYVPWEYAAQFGAAAIHPHHQWLAVPGFVDYAHAAGVAVNVWTVNTGYELRRALDVRVDAAITNHPDRGLMLRNRR